MGPSGSGKSTLLNVLAGRTNVMSHFYPYQGKIAINGVQVNSTIRKMPIAYVTQEDVFYPELTVMETLMFAAKLKLADYSNDEVKDQVDMVINKLGLSKTVGLPVGNE